MIIVVSIIVCVLCSVLFFIVGLLCRHYCYCSKQKQHVEATPQQQRNASPLYETVEFQENVAYIPVHLQN